MLEYGAYSPALSTILCKCKRDSVISSLISGFCGTIKYFIVPKPTSEQVLTITRY